jgi:hypothetical protein
MARLDLQKKKNAWWIRGADDPYMQFPGKRKTLTLALSTFLKPAFKQHF